MSDDSSKTIRQYKAVADKLGEHHISAFFALATALFIMTAMAFETAYTFGWTEPANRAEYAVVMTFANLGKLIIFGTLATIIYGTYRQRTGVFQYGR